MGRITIARMGSHILPHIGHYPIELVFRDRAAKLNHIVGCSKGKYSLKFEF